MDQNQLELMRMGVTKLAMELGFKLALERLAKASSDPASVIDAMEKELIAANRNATPTPNVPNEAFLAIVETGVVTVQQACADVRRALGIA